MMTLEESKKWFKEAKYGLMVHWGLYALLAGEYKGKRMDYIGEWAMSYFHIPIAEYSKLANVFNPIYFDAEEWVKISKDAGMEYMVVTSKHHDGFCMFKSEYDKYNIVDATPFGRDVIGELGEACYKHGMKLGLYYSQEIDWHERHAGGHVRGLGTNHGMDWFNVWDFPESVEYNDFDSYFRSKTLFQVKELLTKYGDICLMWFDTPDDISPEQSRELYDLVKGLQPGCLINSRIGNGMGDYKSLGDNHLPEEYSDDLVEAPVTLNHTWGFKYFDDDWKSPEKIIEIMNKCNKAGANLLLNVGPDGLGRFPGPAVDMLTEAGKKMRELKKN